MLFCYVFFSFRRCFNLLNSNSRQSIHCTSFHCYTLPILTVCIFATAYDLPDNPPVPLTLDFNVMSKYPTSESSVSSDNTIHRTFASKEREREKGGRPSCVSKHFSESILVLPNLTSTHTWTICPLHPLRPRGLCRGRSNGASC